MTRRQVTWRQLRVWKFPDNCLNEVQTCVTPATITHWTEQPPHCRAPCSFEPPPLAPCASPAPRHISSASFHPQISVRFPVVRCRKLILKCVHTSLHTHTNYTHNACTHSSHLNPQWRLRRGHGYSKDEAYCGSEISHFSPFKPTADTHTHNLCTMQGYRMHTHSYTHDFEPTVTVEVRDIPRPYPQTNPQQRHTHTGTQ